MLSDETIRQRNAEIDAVLAQSARYPTGRFHGRGIVMCGGGDVYFTCAWVCCAMLRSLGCTLPIELWYRGPREITPDLIALMESLGVVCVDAYVVAKQHPVRRLDGWELKPFAICHSQFEEVLYLDADNVALLNPAFLFGAEMYAQHGAIFWPDRYRGPGTGQEWLKREAWHLCGVPYRLEPEIEAGQLLIDKRRCWQPLALTLHLNEHSDFYYAWFYGDKDTFHLAWRRTGHEFGLIPHFPVTLGDSQAMLHFTPERDALFQHRNGAKWSLLRENPRVSGFLREDECVRILDALRPRWNGVMRSFPDEMNAREKAWYTELCALRFFRYQLEGHAPRVLELKHDLLIGQGADLMEVAWMIEADKDDQPLLSLRNANAPTCFLRPSEDGAWRGRWLVYSRGGVELTPLR